ncbi:hypothetical protein [Marininema halotolerans]|uniref:Uncharacterized protein n=1 Tax=Marininema halotolerans TaxID=1155944 RepID=A0A1I6TM29_9BACL|nr:hypothetical protein [Marininema halotolerans]SFS90180.1 hypothetical protein SAMN05444972_110121 [Marininema halotolerans]
MMNENYIFKLNNDERDNLRKALTQVPYDPSGNNQYITEIRMAAYKAFPRHIISRLNEQKTSIKPLPYLILENLPLDEKIISVPNSSDDVDGFKSSCMSKRKS